MPSLDAPERIITAKSLTRSMTRSATSFAWQKATYYGEVLPRVRKLALLTWKEAMRAEGDLRVKLTRSFLDLSEFRRSLLGFPSPGRRRDESSERMTNVPGVVQEAITQDVVEPSGPVESASGPAAPDASADASSPASADASASTSASAGPTAGPTEQAPPSS